MLRAFLLCFVLILSSQSFARAVPSEGFADLAESLLPAVVNISTTQTIDPNFQRGPFPFPDLPDGHPFEEFNDFFKRFDERFEGRRSPDQKAQSLGSGFVIDPDGYIVTNSHVVASAEEITVSFDDKEQFEAEVIGVDSKTDLALIKIESSRELPFVSFGDSDDARIGDWAVVIGNPFGLGGTVTAGIISARARDINAGPFDDFIQTDAAINRGNSGGPLFNLDGEVIGINTAIFSPNGGGSVGIGFAIPSALAEPVIRQLKETGTVVRGWLGVRIQHITDEIAEGLGMDKAHGALVAEVTEGSPAEKGGVQVGDVILRFDGKPIEEMKRLPRVVADTDIDKKVKVLVLRDGKKETLNITVKRLKEDGEETPRAKKISDKDTPKEDTSKQLGMSLIGLDKGARTRFKMDQAPDGVLVLKVFPGTAAAERGLRRGDIILEANRTRVTDVIALENAIKAAKKQDRESILLLVQRENESLFMALPVEE